MRTLIIAVSTVVALLASQIPEFLQQYSQRLGGAADELTTIVRHFDEDSRRSGFQRPDALQLMKRNPERFIRDQAARVEENISRLDRLHEQQAVLSGGISLASFFAVLSNYDAPIAQKTYDNFVPALPLSFTGLFFALLGFISSLGVLLALGGILRLGSRSTAEA